jgi:hypothetical protein
VDSSLTISGSNYDGCCKKEGREEGRKARREEDGGEEEEVSFFATIELGSAAGETLRRFSLSGAARDRPDASLRNAPLSRRCDRQGVSR